MNNQGTSHEKKEVPTFTTFALKLSHIELSVFDLGLQPVKWSGHRTGNDPAVDVEYAVVTWAEEARPVDFLDMFYVSNPAAEVGTSI